MSGMTAQADIIVPVYNEEQYLGDFISGLQAMGEAYHVIFVDNGSTDDSAALIRSRMPAGATVVTLARNAGYGGALKAGLARIETGKVVFIDADNEYPPAVIPLIVAALDSAEVVYASRFLDARGREGMSLFQRLGNRITSGIFNRKYGTAFTDLYTGCKGFRSQLADAILALGNDGFSQVVDIGKLVSGRPYAEVPVAYARRKQGGSKMNHLREFIAFLGRV